MCQGRSRMPRQEGNPAASGDPMGCWHWGLAPRHGEAARASGTGTGWEQDGNGQQELGMASGAS